MTTPVIAIFDVGKTNKKLLLFDEKYNLVFERSVRLLETKDEDGYPCENLASLRLSLLESLQEVLQDNKFDIRAINFAAYGASFVYLDQEGHPISPLYNYLKPYPEDLQRRFYDQYGGKEEFARTTASPVLGSLNSGMQLYRMKHEKPDTFSRIRHALHLPQYMSYIVAGNVCSDKTSIGCHTNLWDYEKNEYHKWVIEESIDQKLPDIVPSDTTYDIKSENRPYKVGVGLHDSSSALIPYLVSFHDPFVLISTGTWCISLNPFNNAPLTNTELELDCLYYMQYKGTPVKASRIFAGHEHEQQVKRIGIHFDKPATKYRQLTYDRNSVIDLMNRGYTKKSSLQDKISGFEQRNLSDFDSYEQAYHCLIMDLIAWQKSSTELILHDSSVKRIVVDGGFSKNKIYMNLLAEAFPNMEVYAASMPQATALGAAVSIHHSWNKLPIPTDLIELRLYVGK